MKDRHLIIFKIVLLVSSEVETDSLMTDGWKIGKTDGQKIARTDGHGKKYRYLVSYLSHKEF